MPTLYNFLVLFLFDVRRCLLTIRGQSYCSMNFDGCGKCCKVLYFYLRVFLFTIFPVKKANFKFDMYTNLFGFAIF